MSNEQSSMPYAILRLNDKIFIENRKDNKMISIGKDTYIIRQEKPDFRKIKIMDQTIETQGILGIIEIMNSYYLLYITQSKAIALIDNSLIYQIAQVSFLPLSTIRLDQADNHKLSMNSFHQMISKGMYYYSLTYDLTNLFQYQRGYIDHKSISKTDYLWNSNFMTYFINNYIPIERYFVFCICGFIKRFSSMLQDKPIEHIFIARKKKFNYKANHTQIEAIISYNNNIIFNYVMYSFGYGNDIMLGEAGCMNHFKRYYSHYNQQNYKCTNMIVNILDDNSSSSSSSDAFINKIISRTFDKAKLFQFRCVKEFDKEIKAFISGILSVINAFEYNVINKKVQNDINTEEEPRLIQESRIQKGFFIIISKDGNFSPIEFERCLLWEVIKLFFNKFKYEENDDKGLASILHNDIKKLLYGHNECK